MAEVARTTGALRERVHFEKRGMAADGFGTVSAGGEFKRQFTVSAGYLPLRGSEAVQASRLQGRQPFIVTVRQSSQTREVDATWRMVDARDPKRIFAIAAPPTDPDGRNAWLDILVTEGAPA